jgi:hypothetical protein
MQGVWDPKADCVARAGPGKAAREGKSEARNAVPVAPPPPLLLAAGKAGGRIGIGAAAPGRRGAREPG